MSLIVCSPGDRSKPGLGERMSLAWVIGLIAVVLISGAVATGSNGLALLAVCIFFPAAVALYFVPAMVAFQRGHVNRVAILVLDLFLGWTLVGWVGALVWAHSASAPPQVVEPTTPAPTPASPTDAADMKTCPWCAEPVRAAAIKCRHCGSSLDEGSG